MGIVFVLLGMFGWLLVALAVRIGPSVGSMGRVRTLDLHGK